MSRFIKYINEASDYDNEKFERYAKAIVTECRQFLKECGFGSGKIEPKMFYRGVKDRQFFTSIKPYTNRKPVDTPQEISDIMDTWFKDEFGWYARREGVFTTPNPDRAGGYGYVHVVFPFDGYKYVYTNDESGYDLYNDFLEFTMQYAYHIEDVIVDDLVNNQDMDEDDARSEVESIASNHTKDNLMYVYKFIQADQDIAERFESQYYEHLDELGFTNKNLRSAALSTEVVFGCPEYYLMDIHAYNKVVPYIIRLLNTPRPEDFKKSPMGAWMEKNKNV